MQDLIDLAAKKRFCYWKGQTLVNGYVLQLGKTAFFNQQNLIEIVRMDDMYAVDIWVDTSHVMYTSLPLARVLNLLKTL